MKRLMLIVLGMAVAWPLMASRPLAQGGPAAQAPATVAEAFRVINATDAQALALHAVRSGRRDWGSNLLTRGPLPPNAGFALRPSPEAGCQFDLRLVLADGREAILRQQNVCAQRELRLAAPSGIAVPPADAAPPRPGPVSRAPPQNARPNPQARATSGTGFVVAPGHVLTNLHVVEGCARILVRTPDDRMLTAALPPRLDPQRDLALLTVPGDAGPPLTFRANPVRRGEAIVTYGFPLAGLLSSGPTLTTGDISALSGLQDNPAQFQVSAPVQPGNSGGPLLDRHGHVVGVIVSKLNAQRLAARIGDIPQNVNFAVRGSEALEFLRRAGLTPAAAPSVGPEQSAAEIGETAHPSTLFIRCER